MVVVHNLKTHCLFPIQAHDISYSSLVSVQVMAAVNFVALGGPAPVAALRPLGKPVPKAVRLRALQDGLTLLLPLEHTDAAAIERCAARLLPL